MADQLHLLRDGDLCSLTFLALLLLAIGNNFLARAPGLRDLARRIAAFGFLAFCAYEVTTRPPYDAVEWIHVLLRGLVVAALTFGSVSIVLPALAALKRGLIDTPLQSYYRARSSARQRRTERRDEKERRRNERLRAQQQLAAQSGRYKQQESRAHAARRRADARAQLELAFSLLAPKLGDRFTRQMLNHFLATYMSDDHAPDDVQRRADDLIATLHTHVQEEQVDETMVDLVELDAWFQGQRARIQDSVADEKLKRRLLASLNVRYAELAQRIMENLQP